MLGAAGLPAPIAPPLYHHSPGVDVAICWLELLHRASSVTSRIGEEQ
jgi:hypothetical protein